MKRQNVRSLLLVVGMMAYLLIGAAVFERLESEKEERILKDLILERTNLKLRFNLSDVEWEELTDHVTRYMPHKAGVQWGFAGAVYFSTTVITTIEKTTPFRPVIFIKYINKLFWVNNDNSLNVIPLINDSSLTIDFNSDVIDDVNRYSNVLRESSNQLVRKILKSRGYLRSRKTSSAADEMSVATSNFDDNDGKKLETTINIDDDANNNCNDGVDVKVLNKSKHTKSDFDPEKLEKNQLNTDIITNIESSRNSIFEAENDGSICERISNPDTHSLLNYENKPKTKSIITRHKNIKIDGANNIGRINNFASSFSEYKRNNICSITSNNNNNTNNDNVINNDINTGNNKLYSNVRNIMNNTFDHTNSYRNILTDRKKQQQENSPQTDYPT
ncbi:hypothetical protein HELRODRAFT_159927 [Helobdella robusta]|uniref:Uncharacterized protein n=1 Tax=Helobdella robusta TaxID=6412 RepID=T1EPK4_HELRO|nr:hypothetical protein HELRODRAFT_159927 [Helobdella robusta]ESO05850.1 hypothetical protein HELRODRAFT_159927 [Helobdella robusta]